MDYIQEELLRQKRILTALMTGGQREIAEETDSREKESLSDRQAAEPAARNRPEQETVESPADPRGRTGSEDRSAGALRVRGSRGGWARMQGVSMLPDAEGTAVPVRPAPYGWAAPEVSAGVREISRSIQRDARRYDGGFSIY